MYVCISQSTYLLWHLFFLPENQIVDRNDRSDKSLCLSRYRSGVIERFSIECHKTKTKVHVITLANPKGRRQSSNQSKLEVITRSRHKARENVHARATIGFGFTSDWLKKWRENFEPITE